MLQGALAFAHTRPKGLSPGTEHQFLAANKLWDSLLQDLAQKKLGAVGRVYVGGGGRGGCNAPAELPSGRLEGRVEREGGWHGVWWWREAGGEIMKESVGVKGRRRPLQKRGCGSDRDALGNWKGRDRRKEG